MKRDSTANHTGHLNNIRREGTFLVAALVVAFAMYLLTHMVSSWAVNRWLLPHVPWTLYEGYAEQSFFFFLILAGYAWLKRPVNVMNFTFFAFLAYLTIESLIDIYSHYDRFYVRTNVNGHFTFKNFLDSIDMTTGASWIFYERGREQFLSEEIWRIADLMLLPIIFSWLKTATRWRHSWRKRTQKI